MGFEYYERDIIEQKEFYERCLRKYSKKNKSKHYRVKLENSIELLNPQKDDIILDAGCGIGAITIELLKYGCKVEPIDYSDEGIKSFYALMKMKGIKNAKAQKASITDIPFSDKSFTKIICSDVIEHLHYEDTIQAIKEFYRVLRKGGHLAIYTPSRIHIAEYIRPKIKSHVGLMTMKEVKNILITNGFKIIRAHYKPSAFPIAHMLDKLFCNIPFIGVYFQKRICVLGEK